MHGLKTRNGLDELIRWIVLMLAVVVVGVVVFCCVLLAAHVDM
jgi:hypothetical protein